MSARFQTFSMSGQTDAQGNAEFGQSGGYELSHVAAWNALVVSQGTIYNGTVTVLVDGTEVEGGMTSNLRWKGGPIFTQSNSTVTIQCSGFDPDVPIIATFTGIYSTTDDPGEVSALPSSGYGGGSTQSDPAQLLSAAFGPAFIENETIAVPGAGVHAAFLGPFNVSGYAGVMVYGDPPPASTSLFGYLVWSDKFGNNIATSQIDNMIPKFITLYECLGPQLSIIIGNVDAAQHNVANFTVIPLVHMPPEAARIIPQTFGAAPTVFTSIPTPSAEVMIASSASVPATTTVILTASFVWKGKAYWQVSPVQSGTSGSQSWFANLTVVDANGGQIFVDGIFGLPAAVPSPPTAPREVWLPPGQAQILYRNTAAVVQNPFMNLIAA